MRKLFRDLLKYISESARLRLNFFGVYFGSEYYSESQFRATRALSLIREVFRGPAEWPGPIEMAFIANAIYIRSYGRPNRSTESDVTNDREEYEIVPN